MKIPYKPPKITSGDLRTPIVFYGEIPNDGPEVGSEEREQLYECMCEVYSSSRKDLEILSSVEYKDSVTINIRDTQGEYYPENDHVVEITDYRYQGKIFNIIDVRPNLQQNDFINIVLAVTGS